MLFNVGTNLKKRAIVVTGTLQQLELDTKPGSIVPLDNENAESSFTDNNIPELPDINGCKSDTPEEHFKLYTFSWLDNASQEQFHHKFWVYAFISFALLNDSELTYTSQRYNSNQTQN